MSADSSSTTPLPGAGSTEAPPTKEQFKEFFADPRFHQTFSLPADPSRGRDEPYKVKYADFGFRRDADGGTATAEGILESVADEEHVVLFFGPLLATRMTTATKDAIAKRKRVRIVNPDRPGIGGTDAVPAEKLLETWREVVPALLKHLGIRHVSVVTQSGGLIYALDAILHNPHILHPTRPYLAIGGPWVHPNHTSVTTMSLANSLPTSLLGMTDKMASFINANVAPLMGSSINVIDTTKRWMFGGSGDSLAGVGNDTAEARFEESSTMSALEGVFAEGVHGVSEEAKLLLQRVPGVTGWSDWGDVDQAVPRLVPALRSAGINGRLRVDVFFAEKDSMIGDAGSKGPQWLKECFRAKEGNDPEQLKVTFEVVEKTDHDSVWDLRWDAIGKVLDRAAGKGWDMEDQGN